MAYTKTVTNAVAVAGLHTLTLSNVTNLFVGDKIKVQGCGNNFDGTHTVTAINTTNLTVSYVKGNQTHTAVVVTGILNVVVQWITTADLQIWLGIDVATNNDTLFMGQAVDAANEWVFRKRQEAAYTLDRAALVPTADVFLGTVSYAAGKYRERGAIDGYASYDSFNGTTPTMSMGQIMALIGCGKPQVG
jgi:hypothetical protein